MLEKTSLLWMGLNIHFIIYLHTFSVTPLRIQLFKSWQSQFFPSILWTGINIPGRVAKWIKRPLLDALGYDLEPRSVCKYGFSSPMPSGSLELGTPLSSDVLDDLGLGYQKRPP